MLKEIDPCPCSCSTFSESIGSVVQTLPFPVHPRENPSFS
jgi:hypothetical protein